VLSWSRATRDLLKSFGWGIGALHRLATATMVPSPRRLPHSISRSPVSGDTPQRPRIASPGIISAKSRLALCTKGFDPFAEIRRASPESHRFLAKSPFHAAGTRRCLHFGKCACKQAAARTFTDIGGVSGSKTQTRPRKVTGSSQRSSLHAAGPPRCLHFGKCACKQAGNLFPAYQKRGELDRRQMAGEVGGLGGEGLQPGLPGHDAADVDEIISDHAEADPALHSAIAPVAAAIETVSPLDHADATLASGAPFLAVAEPALLLLALALRALGGAIGRFPWLRKGRPDLPVSCMVRS
jgi:hypothetical protein